MHATGNDIWKYQMEIISLSHLSIYIYVSSFLGREIMEKNIILIDLRKLEKFYKFLLCSIRWIKWMKRSEEKREWFNISNVS